MKKFLRSLIIAATWLFIWQAVSLIVNNNLIFPGPYAVFLKLIEIAVKPIFWTSVLRSIASIFAGFLTANIMAVSAAVVSGKSNMFRKFFEPLVSVIKATPVASFIVVVLIMIGRDWTPVFIAFLMVFPIIYQNVLTGIDERNEKLLEVADMYGMTKLERLKFIHVPTILPGYIAAVKTGLGLSWKAGIAAEVLCNTKNTLGGAIYSAKVYLEIPELFAWTTFMIILSILLEKLTVFVVRKIGGEKK